MRSRHVSCRVLSTSFLLQGALDNINLFQVITIMAFFTLLPFSMAFEGLPALPANLSAAVSSIVALALFIRWLHDQSRAWLVCTQHQGCLCMASQRRSYVCFVSFTMACQQPICHTQEKASLRGSSLQVQAQGHVCRVVFCPPRACWPTHMNVCATCGASTERETRGQPREFPLAQKLRTETSGFQSKLVCVYVFAACPAGL